VPFANKAIRDRARKQVAQRVRAGEPCCFCGRPIALDLKYPHPDSFVVDHRIPSSHGGSDHYGDDQQIRPAHAKCNRSRSNHPDGSVGRNSGVLG
jgi:5-methylcytosine-specific restriction endonuclease McrA